MWARNSKLTFLRKLSEHMLRIPISFQKHISEEETRANKEINLYVKCLDFLLCSRNSSNSSHSHKNCTSITFINLQLLQKKTKMRSHSPTILLDTVVDLIATIDNIHQNNICHYCLHVSF